MLYIKHPKKNGEISGLKLNAEIYEKFLACDR